MPYLKTLTPVTIHDHAYQINTHELVIAFDDMAPCPYEPMNYALQLQGGLPKPSFITLDEESRKIKI